jgi:ABC-type nitrate/sulfonate/bicarbonate transport system permease component
MSAFSRVQAAPGEQLTGPRGSSRIAAIRAASPRWINVPGVLFVIAVIAVWQLLVGSKLLNSSYFPAPTAIWSTGVSLAGSGALSGPLAHTLAVTLVGWLVASAVGLLLGVLIGSITPVWKYGMASIDVIRSIPAITFVPIIALIFGISIWAEIYVVIYVSLWPVLLNTVSGLHHVRAGYRDTARMMRLSRVTYIRKIALPSTTPEIMVGLRLGMGLAITLSVVGELLINPAGLGFALLQAEQRIEPSSMYVYVILIGILGFLLNALLLGVARAFIPQAARGVATVGEGSAA